MLQACVPNLSSLFHTCIANVFVWMLHMLKTYVPMIYLEICLCFCNGFKYFLSVLQVF